MADNNMGSRTIVDRLGRSLCMQQLQKGDLCQVDGLIDQVGWSCSLSDLEDILSACPGAMWGAFTKDGTLLGYCSVYEINPKLSYLGHYITDKDHRGRGIGKQLFDHVLETVGGTEIVIDAVTEHVSTYARAGFHSIEDIIEATVFFKDKATPEGRNVPHAMMQSESVGAVSVTSVTRSNVEDVVRYDRRVCHPGRRDEFMTRWLLSSKRFSYCATAAESREVSGVIVLRHVRDGTPLVSSFYARDIQTARALLHTVVTNHASSKGLLKMQYPARCQPQIERVLSGHEYSLEDIQERMSNSIDGSQLESFSWTDIYCVTNLFSVIM